MPNDSKEIDRSNPTPSIVECDRRDPRCWMRTGRNDWGRPRGRPQYWLQTALSESGRCLPAPSPAKARQTCSSYSEECKTCRLRYGGDTESRTADREVIGGTSDGRIDVGNPGSIQRERNSPTHSRGRNGERAIRSSRTEVRKDRSARSIVKVERHRIGGNIEHLVHEPARV